MRPLCPPRSQRRRPACDVSRPVSLAALRHMLQKWMPRLDDTSEPLIPPVPSEEPAAEGASQMSPTRRTAPAPFF